MVSDELKHPLLEVVVCNWRCSKAELKLQVRSSRKAAAAGETYTLVEEIAVLQIGHWAPSEGVMAAQIEHRVRGIHFELILARQRLAGTSESLERQGDRTAQVFRRRGNECRKVVLLASRRYNDTVSEPVSQLQLTLATCGGRSRHSIGAASIFAHQVVRHRQCWLPLTHCACHDGEGATRSVINIEKILNVKMGVQYSILF